MTLVQRLTLTLAVLAAAVLAVLGLTFAGAAGEGPLSHLLSQVGLYVSSVEHRMARQLRGPGRAAELAWLGPLWEEPDSLRSPQALLLGAYTRDVPETLEGIVEVEKALRQTLPLIQVYTAWGDRPDQQFPWRTARAIWDLGSIPVITWEPWLSDFDRARRPHLPPAAERDAGGMAAVARGVYDVYIDAWAADAAAFEHPFLLRFAHEMNDPYRYPWGPHHNRAEDFVAAWRHVVQRFRAAGADNVVWVWSPHLAYDYAAHYPGDDVVDWVGTGVLNYGTVAYWSRWWSFEEIFGQKYEAFAAYGKPIMIAELGCLAVGGDRASWFREALTELPQRYPAVKAALFFHVSHDATVTYQALDWSFSQDDSLSRIITESILPWSSAKGDSAKGESAGRR